MRPPRIEIEYESEGFARAFAKLLGWEIDELAV